MARVLVMAGGRARASVRCKHCQCGGHHGECAYAFLHVLPLDVFPRVSSRLSKDKEYRHFARKKWLRTVKSGAKSIGHRLKLQFSSCRSGVRAASSSHHNRRHNSRRSMGRRSKCRGPTQTRRLANDRDGRRATRHGHLRNCGPCGNRQSFHLSPLSPRNRRRPCRRH